MANPQRSLNTVAESKNVSALYALLDDRFAKLVCPTYLLSLGGKADLVLVSDPPENAHSRFQSKLLQRHCPRSRRSSNPDKSQKCMAISQREDSNEVVIEIWAHLGGKCITWRSRVGEAPYISLDF